MKTMIANAEKLEKLGDLIEVEGTNVTFGGNVEVDGIVKSNEMTSRIVTIQGSETGIVVDLPRNYLYLVYFVTCNASVTIPVLTSAQYTISSVGFDDEEGTTFYIHYNTSNNAMNFYMTTGEDNEMYGDIIITPIAYIN